MFFERKTFRRAARGGAALLAAFLLLSQVNALAGGAGRKTNNSPNQVPALILDGGRRLEFVRAISAETEIKPKRSVWKKIVDLVAGPPEFHRLVRPYGIALDSLGRVIVSDPGVPAVHILDFEKQKYEQLSGGKGQAFRSPMAVAVDAQDNIYVTDSALGIVFVFDSKGRHKNFIGKQLGRAGYFQRPTGIAVDSTAKRLYVADTLGHKVFVLDLTGHVLGSFGERGLRPGQFNFPTEIVVRGQELLVVDAMNFRVQTFSREGAFVRSFGSLGERTGSLFRPKGLALDSEGNIYVADALLETVQVFNEQGRLLYFFGHSGAGLGEFQLPSGLCIDPRNRIYVSDSLNQRIQIFQFTSAPRPGKGSGR
jgi:DNA-binding beta-propeller fold protein YncE